jgi:FlaG/FlaF family flagellin (archaellin)
MKQLKSLKNSDAASPVIGVMLMVVITVILAAAVSSYSSGMIKGLQVAPSASFDIDMRKDVETPYGNMSYIAIQMITGDPVHTKDLKIITINPNARGNQTRHVLPNVNNTKCLSFTGTSPFWNKGNSPVTGQFFGEYLLEPGMTMLADEYSNYKGPASWDIQSDGRWDYIPSPAGDMTGMQAMFADWGCDPDDPSDDTVHRGDIVTIKIVHTPSNKVIFSKDVVVR